MSEKKEIPDGYKGKIGPYFVKGTIAGGGSCQVKEAVHEKTGQKVAIKIMKNLKDQDCVGKYFQTDEGTRIFVTA